MKTKKLHIVGLLLAGSALTSCQKEPTASFKADKTEYVAGETIKLTNTSADAHSYLWTLPAGYTPSTSTATNIELPTNVNSGDQLLTVKLETFSKNQKKKNETSQNIIVYAATGNAMFWNCGSCAGVLPITVLITVNGIVTYRSITSAYSSAPSCGISTCANFTGLDVGTYTYAATDGTVDWSGTVTVTKNGCARLLLQ